jgi:hypothetical protein
MRFYTNSHKYYCGIDLHTKMMYVCILNNRGKILVHKNIPTDSAKFLKLIAPYHLKWAMSEATVLFMRESDKAKRFVEKYARIHGKGKAMAILTHKLGRAVYYVWKRKDAFDERYFFANMKL